MKKLLTILSAFTVTATSASTVACDDETKKIEESKPDNSNPSQQTDEQKLKNAVDELQKLSSLLSINTINDEINELIDIDIKGEGNIKIILDKNGVEITNVKILDKDGKNEVIKSDIKDNPGKFTLEIILKVEAKEAVAKIKDVTITRVNPGKKADEVVKELKQIKNQIVYMELQNINLEKLTDEIKRANWFKKDFDAGVTLKDNKLELFKDNNNSKGALAKVQDLVDNAVIWVNGIVQIQNEERQFDFSIKLLNQDQGNINKAVTMLNSIKNQDVGLEADKLTSENLKTKIKLLPGFKNAINMNVTLVNDNLNLFKDNNNSRGKLVDKNYIAYNNIVWVNGMFESNGKKAEFNFTIKIVDIIELNKKILNDAITEVQKFQNQKIRLNSTEQLTLENIKAKIKLLPGFINAINMNVTLVNDNLNLFKDNNNLKGNVVDQNSINYNDKLWVSGLFELNGGKIEFNFTIKIAKENNSFQQIVDNAVSELQKIQNKDVILSSTDLTTEKVTDAIKNLQEYKEAISNGAKLKDGKFTFEKDNKITIVFAIDQIITVKGTIYSGREKQDRKEKDFAFTVHLKAVK